MLTFRPKHLTLSLLSLLIKDIKELCLFNEALKYSHTKKGKTVKLLKPLDLHYQLLCACQHSGVSSNGLFSVSNLKAN